MSKGSFGLRGSGLWVVLRRPDEVGIGRAPVAWTAYTLGLAAIIGDKSVSRKVEGQQKQITDLEKRVEELRQELGSAKTSRAKSIRKEQNVVLERIDELSKVKIAIMQKIKNASNRAQQLVERGMTPDEVVKLAGAPRSKTKYAFYTGYSYGKFWVQFENGVVRCLILNFENKSCKSYEQRYRENLAK